jgi:hypothetical protein
MQMQTDRVNEVLAQQAVRQISWLGYAGCRMPVGTGALDNCMRLCRKIVPDTQVRSTLVYAVQADPLHGTNHNTCRSTVHMHACHGTSVWERPVDCRGPDIKPIDFSCAHETGRLLTLLPEGTGRGVVPSSVADALPAQQMAASSDMLTSLIRSTDSTFRQASCRKVSALVVLESVPRDDPESCLVTSWKSDCPETLKTNT